MRCCGLVLVMLACGCLDKNPLFVDPTMPGGPTSEGTTTVSPTSDPGPTTADPTDNAGSTLVEETTGPSTTFETTVDTTDTPDTEFPVVCGDGVHAYGIEECDDGNMLDDDECGNDCKLPECGDGEVEGLEQCEDGNLNDNDDCPSTCMLAVCGDGFHWFGAEACDDGNDIDTDACLVGCTPASCGDGEVHMGVESCDDGNDVNTDACDNMCKWPEKVIFVTSTVHIGDVGGLAGADGICQDRADLGSVPPGTYRAWLSDSAEAAGTRLAHSPGPYILAGGPKVVVAMNWGDLTDGTLLAPIDRTELLGPPPSTEGCIVDGVHTNTLADGKIWNLDVMAGCGDWMSQSGTTMWGSTKQTGVGWSEQCPGDLCASYAPFYCIQQ